MLEFNTQVKNHNHLKNLSRTSELLAETQPYKTGLSITNDITRLAKGRELIAKWQ